MTQTAQPCSWAYLSETGKDLNINRPDTEDNMSLLLQVFDSLNSLYEKINRLDYMLRRKDIEQILYQSK